MRAYTVNIEGEVIYSNVGSYTVADESVVNATSSLVNVNALYEVGERAATSAVFSASFVFAEGESVSSYSEVGFIYTDESNLNSLNIDNVDDQIVKKVSTVPMGNSFSCEVTNLDTTVNYAVKAYAHSENGRGSYIYSSPYTFTTAGIMELSLVVDVQGSAIIFRASFNNELGVYSDNHIVLGFAVGPSSSDLTALREQYGGGNGDFPIYVVDITQEGETFYGRWEPSGSDLQVVDNYSEDVLYVRAYATKDGCGDEVTYSRKLSFSFR